MISSESFLPSLLEADSRPIVPTEINVSKSSVVIGDVGLESASEKEERKYSKEIIVVGALAFTYVSKFVVVVGVFGPESAYEKGGIKDSFSESTYRERREKVEK